VKTKPLCTGGMDCAALCFCNRSDHVQTVTLSASSTLQDTFDLKLHKKTSDYSTWTRWTCASVLDISYILLLHTPIINCLQQKALQMMAWQHN